MKSPFPGMDPYIEGCGLWGDFHNHLIERIFDGISAALPEGYIARTARRSYIVLVESEAKDEQSFIPDVKVLGRRAPRSGSSKGSAAATISPPDEGESVLLRAFVDVELVESFIDIYELEPERRLVTSVEVLSPSNKRRGSKGWKLYLRKRNALLLGKANLVEIDLLRRGTRMPMFDPLPNSPYYLLVAREQWAPSCRAWPALYDRPLPPLTVPLSKPDPDIILPLQPLVEAIYERSRYSEDIDYTRPLDPPLGAEQAAWLERELRLQGRLRRKPTRKSRRR